MPYDNNNNQEAIMQDNFARNLRLLCSYYKSIADVCRRIPINRTQFNKYLSGDSTPSRFVLRKICDFFGVEEYEIYLPHPQFSQIIQVRPSLTQEGPVARPYIPHVDKLQEHSQGRLEKYIGYYFEIHYSMAVPGLILRSLVHLSNEGGAGYYQRVERLPDQENGRIYHSKYLGCAFFLSDRIFMTDYESLTGNELSQTILYPTFKNRVTRLSGLKMGVSSSDRREPACVRVVYEWLGERVDMRKALRLCGLFSPDSTQIDPGVRSSIQNSGRADDVLFLAVPR